MEANNLAIIKIFLIEDNSGEFLLPQSTKIPSIYRLRKSRYPIIDIPRLISLRSFAKDPYFLTVLEISYFPTILIVSSRRHFNLSNQSRRKRKHVGPN